VKIWIPQKYGLSHLDHLIEQADIEIADDPADLPSDPANVDFLVPTFLDQPSMRPLLPSMTGLKVLQLPSSGSDGWAEVTRPEATIAHARGVHDSSTAEWVLTAILASLRELPALHDAQRDARWQPRRGRDLLGKRILLIGAGSIGSAVARRLKPFGVRLTKVARTARPDEDIHPITELPALLPNAEVVILLVPLTAETRGLVDREFLAALPDGALLVNAARGPVVDTEALLAELGTGRLAAALDVTDPEPLPAGHPLWREPHTLITPHIAAQTNGMLPRVYDLVARQLERFLAGEPLLNQVVR